MEIPNTKQEEKIQSKTPYMYVNKTVSFEIISKVTAYILYMIFFFKMYEIRISLKIQYESYFQNMQINIIFNRNFSENLFFVSTHDVLTISTAVYTRK